MKERTYPRGPGIPLVKFSNTPASGEDTTAAPPTPDSLDNSQQPASGNSYIEITSLVDSPYQHRIIYPEKELLILGESLKSIGQTSAIRVRPLPDGKFELIAGHRRKRAAALVGIPKLKADVVQVDDSTAALELLADNENSEQVGDFERAKAYRVMMNSLGITQKRIADAQGVTQGMVSKRLSFFKLPTEVIEQLEKYPRAYSYKVVEKILPALEENPELGKFVAEATAFVGAEDWSAETLVAQLLQRLKKKKEDANPKPDNLLAISDSTSRPLLTIKAKPKGQFLVQLAEGVDSRDFAARLGELLIEETAKPGTKIRIKEDAS